MAELDQTFQRRLNELRNQSEQISNAIRGIYPRLWMVPSSDDWNGDLHDLAGITQPFKREELNQKYSEIISSGKGSVGTAISYKLQIDYLAVMERGFRTRHASRVRWAMHAAGRRKGHGSRTGIFTGLLMNHVQNFARAGENNASNNNDQIQANA